MRGSAAGGILVAALMVSACEGGTDPGGASEVRTDTVGDTIRVHTITGSRWGAPVELVEVVRIGARDGAEEETFGSVSGLAGAPDGGVYVYDRQVPVLRRYGPDGTYVGALGRSGAGPGEYADSDGGLAVLPDGRVVLRDPANARFTVFGPDGAHDGTWPGRGGHFTSQPLAVDTAGNTYTVVTRPLQEGESGWPGAQWVTRVVRITPDGTPADTVDIPRYDFHQAELRAQGKSGSMSSTVPYTGQFEWAVHPTGAFVTVIGDRYAVDLHRRDGRVVRMVRNPEPVAVDPEEKAAVEQRTTEGMRRMAPDWKWNATPIPDTKAPIEDVSTAADGRIWVRVATPSVRLPEEAPAAGEPARLPSFRSPAAWDVFEADGTYVGRVNAPLELAEYPDPVFGRDHVWAVATDDLGVNYVVRYRIGAPVPDPG